MRRTGGWQRIGMMPIAMAVVIGGGWAWKPGAGAEPGTVQEKSGSQAKAALQPESVEDAVLDAGASSEVKKVLTELRKRIREKNHRFIVGYSKAAARKLSQLAGTRPPGDLKDRIARQRVLGAQHLLAHPTVNAARLRLQAGPNAPKPTMPTFDWSQRGVVGSVKDQDQCGDCWCFATVGVFESMYAIRNGLPNLLKLSEEQLLRCNTENPRATCCGGWWAFDYIRVSGLVGAEKLPYTSGSISCDNGVPSAPIPACADVAGRRYQAAAWDYVDGAEGVPNTELMKKALCDHGPLIVGVNATDLFQNYKGGLFDERAGGPINHAVMIVGWTPDGWIVRNSWGPGWGQNGYILITYDSNQIGFGAAWVEPVVFQP